MTNTRNTANRELAAISRVYHRAIPLSAIFDAVRPVGEPIQEDGLPWSGLLCGREGRASIALYDSAKPLAADKYLQLQWYRMPSGNYEVNAYVS